MSRLKSGKDVNDAYQMAQAIGEGGGLANAGSIEIIKTRRIGRASPGQSALV